MASPLSPLPCSPPFVSCRCRFTWSLSAGRGKAVPATVRTKAPTSTCATPYTTQTVVDAYTHHRRRQVVAMPRQRDVPGEDEPLAPHQPRQEGSQRGARPRERRPPDIAASVARSRLLDHDLSASTTPELHCPATPADVRHSLLMRSTRHVQRPREREAAVQARPLKRRRQRRRWRWTGISARGALSVVVDVRSWDRGPTSGQSI